MSSTTQFFGGGATGTVGASAGSYTMSGGISVLASNCASVSTGSLTGGAAPVEIFGSSGTSGEMDICALQNSVGSITLQMQVIVDGQSTPCYDKTTNSAQYSTLFAAGQAGSAISSSCVSGTPHKITWTRSISVRVATNTTGSSQGILCLRYQTRQ